MKVNLVKETTIINYSKKHAESKSACIDFLNKIKLSNWEIPGDIKCTFRAADILGNQSQRVVFNIAGNKHRFICKYKFGVKSVRLYVLWLGTHAEYTKLCKKGQQYEFENHTLFE